MSLKILIIKDQHDRTLTTYVDRALELMDRVVDSITEVIAFEDYTHTELKPVNSFNQFIETMKKSADKVDIIINTSFNNQAIELVNSIDSYKVHLLYYKTPAINNNIISYLTQGVDKVFTLSRVFTKYYDEMGIKWELIDFAISIREHDYLNYRKDVRVIDYRYRDKNNVVSSLIDISLTTEDVKYIDIRKKQDKNDILFNQYNRRLKTRDTLTHSVSFYETHKFNPPIDEDIDYKNEFENVYGEDSKYIYAYVLDHYNIDIIIENLYRNKIIIIKESEMAKDLVLKYGALNNRIIFYSSINDLIDSETRKVALKKIDINNNIAGTIICYWADKVMKEAYKEQSVIKLSSHRSIIFDNFNKAKAMSLKISQTEEVVDINNYFGKLDVENKDIAFIGIGNPGNIRELFQNNTIEVYDISNYAMTKVRERYEYLDKTSMYDVLNPYKVDEEYDLVVVNNILNYQEYDYYSVIDNIMKNFVAEEYIFIINTMSHTANFKYEEIDIRLLFSEFRDFSIEKIGEEFVSMYIITVKNNRTDTL